MNRRAAPLRPRLKDMHYERPQARPATAASYADIAPKFAQLTDEVLFGDVWNGPSCQSATGA